MNSVEVPDASAPDVRCREAFLSRKKVAPMMKGRKKIAGNETNGDHCIYVWEHFGKKAAASQMCIIAHSAGTLVFFFLLGEESKHKEKRSKEKIATDFTFHIYKVEPVLWNSCQHEVPTLLLPCINLPSKQKHSTQLLPNSHTEAELLPKLRGVAFTDSVHWVSPRHPKATRAFIKEHAINWVRSEKPLDSRERSEKDDCRCVSAGKCNS